MSNTDRLMYVVIGMAIGAMLITLKWMEVFECIYIQKWSTIPEVDLRSTSSNHSPE